MKRIAKKKSTREKKIIYFLVLPGALLILFIHYHLFGLSIGMGSKLIAGLFLLALIHFMLKSMKLLIFLTVLFLMLTATHFRRIENLMEALRWIPFTVYTLMFLSYIMKNKNLPRKIEWIDKIIFLIIIAMFLSAFYSINLSITVMRSVTFLLLYISIFWVIYPEINSNEDAEEVIDMILYAASIPFFLGLILLGLSSSALWGARFRGYFSNPNSIGLISAILLPLVLWKSLEKKSTFAKIFLFIMIVSLLFSGSRAGILGASFGGIFYFLTTQKKYRIPTALIGLTVIIIIFTFGESAVGSLSSYLRLGAKPQGEEVLNEVTTGRMEKWVKMISLVKEKPFFGYGFGTEDIIFKYFNIPITSAGDNTHNSFIGLTVQMGILGFILFFSPLFYLLSRPINPGEKVNYALTGLLIGGLVGGFFESWMYAVGNAYAFPFWLGVALLIRSKKETDNESSD